MTHVLHASSSCPMYSAHHWPQWPTRLFSVTVGSSARGPISLHASIRRSLCRYPTVFVPSFLATFLVPYPSIQHFWSFFARSFFGHDASRLSRGLQLFSTTRQSIVGGTRRSWQPLVRSKRAGISELDSELGCYEHLREARPVLQCLGLVV
ncbi:hypothetical protein C8F04DRAFT_1098220 [Mycena alexandri]|uniref:Uncharacterized protein n=1 Tax=Mycena alexandri TaxID=1745969 RepID=A0AAD6X4Z7_9AGAR|nr:hypothetical protein C8F04DRAFT_1098220 [Mycena alexandri]